MYISFSKKHTTAHYKIIRTLSYQPQRQRRAGIHFFIRRRSARALPTVVHKGLPMVVRLNGDDVKSTNSIVNRYS